MKVQVILAILSVLAMTTYASPWHHGSAARKWDRFGLAARHANFGGSFNNRQDFQDFIRKIIEYLRKLKEKKNPRGESV